MATKSYNMVKNVIFSSITTFSSFFLFIILIFVGRVLGVYEEVVGRRGSDRYK